MLRHLSRILSFYFRAYLKPPSFYPDIPRIPQGEYFSTFPFYRQAGDLFFFSPFIMTYAET